MSKESQTTLAVVDNACPPAKIEPTIGAMLQAALQGGVTSENVGVMERLFALYERDQERSAERQFAEAFAALQAEMPTIQAVKVVPNDNGTTRYCYAPYEDIMEQMRPLLQKHHFTVSFSSDFKEDRIIQTCTVQHISGHKRSNQALARVSGPPKTTPTQADGSTSTYAKRFAFCDAFNITIERDNDARAEGSDKVISFDQVAYLKERVKETGSDEKRFLALAGVAKYEEIPADKYDLLIIALGKKKPTP